MTFNFNSTLCFALAIACSFIAVVECDAQDRRRNEFDPAKYLKRLDRNRNGILETQEMVGRTANYLKDLGFDPGKPVAISKVVEKISGKENANQKKSSRSEVVIKVPGFGVDAEKKEVANFAPNDATSEQGLEKKYGQEIMEQVERTMKRYDRNRDGSLDSSEIKKARWGRPTPQESDLNRDGSLSKAELAHRYSAREREERDQARAAETKARMNASRNAKNSKSVSVRNSRPIRSGSANNSRISTNRSSTRDPNSGRDRYRKYAQGLMKQYDKNKDGRIDKEEIKDMRRPPAGADMNNDGYVTEQELADVLSGKKSSQGATTAATAKLAKQRESENNRRSTRYRNNSSNRPSSQTKSVSFSGNDKNGDGQLQMSEYADDWDGEVLAEFDRIDRNRDGVITAKEWAKKDQ